MMIEFRIKTLDGADHKIAIDEESTIQELKDTIFAQMGVEQSLQRLIFCGRAMQDDKKLKEYNVNGKVVHMVQRAPPGPESQASSSVSSSVPVTPENRQSNPINSSHVQQMFGLGGSGTPQVVYEEHRSGQSPTAIRLENLREIINDIKRGVSDLTGVIYPPPEMPPEWEVRLENEEDVEPPRSTSASQNQSCPADFADLVQEVNELERGFAPYREEFISIVRDASIISGPLREGDLQRRMGIADRVTVVYHHLAHAYHLISDINLLLSHENSRLASEVFIRQPHHLQGHQSMGNVNVAGVNPGVQVRPGNQNSNLPMNIGVIDPITVQLQIETRVPIGMGVLTVPRVQAPGQQQQATQNIDSNRAENNESSQNAPNVPRPADQLDRDEVSNNQTTGDQQANKEPSNQSTADQQANPEPSNQPIGNQQAKPEPSNQSIGDQQVNKEPSNQSTADQQAQPEPFNQSTGDQQDKPQSNQSTGDQQANPQPSNQSTGDQQANMEPTVNNLREHFRQLNDNQRENPVIGFRAAGELGGFEIPIDMEELPQVGHNLQNIFSGQQNVGGAEHNVFLAQMPLHGGQPSAELIQQILTSVIRQGLVPGVLPNANWQVIYPNFGQNVGANNANPAANPAANNAANPAGNPAANPAGNPAGNPAANAPSGTTQNQPQNEGSNETRPINRGPTIQNPQRVNPILSGPLRYQLAPEGLRVAHVVFDQVLQCDSLHVRQALRERSQVYPCEVPSQFTDSGSPRALLNLESLYQRFDRNQRSPYAIVLATHLLLREAIVPGVNRFLSTRDLIMLASPLAAYVRDLVQSDFSNDYVDRLLDALIERHRTFYDRIPRIVTIRPDVDFTASFRNVLQHYMRDLVALLTQRDPGDFCRTMRILIPRLYHDFCTVMDYCFTEPLSSFQELYRAFFIYLVENMDETTRDILYSIAIYNMNVATDRMERQGGRFSRPQFIVPSPYYRFLAERDDAMPDEEEPNDTSMASSEQTERTIVTPTAPVEDSPMPSSSTVTPPSEPSALPTRNIYSGAVPRTRPVMRTSRKVNNKMPVRHRSNVPSTSGCTTPSVSRSRTNTAPTTPQTPNEQTTPDSTIHSLMQINRRIDTPRPPARRTPTRDHTPPDDSQTESVPMFPNFDLWGTDMQQILQRDRLSQSSQSVPFSDAYISGMPLKKRHCVRQARPPTTLNGFIEDTVLDLEERIEVEHRFREMFEEFVREGLRDRREVSTDFNPDRFSAIEQLLNDETKNSENSENGENSRRNSGGAA